MVSAFNSKWGKILQGITLQPLCVLSCCGLSWFFQTPGWSCRNDWVWNCHLGIDNGKPKGVLRICETIQSVPQKSTFSVRRHVCCWLLSFQQSFKAIEQKGTETRHSHNYLPRTLPKKKEKWERQRVLEVLVFHFRRDTGLHRRRWGHKCKEMHLNSLLHISKLYFSK